MAKGKRRSWPSPGPPAHGVRDPGVDSPEHPHRGPQRVVLIPGTTLHFGYLHHRHLRLRHDLEPEPHIAHPDLRNRPAIAVLT
jgi:hypothetical protein